MKRKLLFTLLAAVMGCMCSCTPTFPDDPTGNTGNPVTPPGDDTTSLDTVPSAPQPVSVNLCMEVLTEWGMEFDVYLPTRAVGAPSDSIRFVVRVRPDGSDSIAEYVYLQRFDEEHVAAMDLLPGRYSINVWADYIMQPCGSLSPYYCFPRFGEVTVNDTAYAINTASKDAFCGAANVIIDSDEPTDSIRMTLHRPVSRIQFVLCDTTHFLQQERERLQLAADATVDLGAYSARLRYPAFLPIAYDMVHGNPCDSKAGVSSAASLCLADDNRLIIAYDYIFTGKNKDFVTVAAELYDPSGVKVWEASSMDVPLVRNCNTSIKVW